MDDISDLVRSVFSPDQLQVSPPSLVAPLRIPDRSKQYLLTVGLPREIDFVGGCVLRFNLLDRLPTLRQLLPDHAARIDPGWDACRFLTLDDDAGYVLNQADGGSIWSVALDSTSSDFVNSSVELLGWFIAEYTHFRTARIMDAIKHPGRAIDEMERRMQDMDPRAMTDDARYWPPILDDARLYLS